MYSFIKSPPEKKPINRSHEESFPPYSISSFFAERKRRERGEKEREREGNGESKRKRKNKR